MYNQVLYWMKYFYYGWKSGYMMDEVLWWGGGFEGVKGMRELSCIQLVD